MPYRRLPNTDQARLRAFRNALKRSESVSPNLLPFSQKLLLELKHFYPHFHQMLEQYHQSRDRQAAIGRELAENYRTARLYVSHFLQVINFAIVRGEFKPEIRKFYGIAKDDGNVPEIGTEQQLLHWGKLLIEGEEKRMATGATRIYNPSLAMVRIRYEKFVEVYNRHKDLQNTTQKLMDRTIEFRAQADKLITAIWNDIENFYDKHTPEEKRNFCSEYGVVYVYRPSERKQYNYQNE